MSDPEVSDPIEAEPTRKARRCRSSPARATPFLCGLGWSPWSA